MACVLVIDDLPELRLMVGKFLTGAGHEVLEAEDGAAALKLLGERTVDLVLTDLYMPGMDGIEFTIRLGQQTSKPKIIAMSGGGWRDKLDVLAIAERLGAARTLEKPFSGAQLLAAVRAVLEP